MRVRILVCVCSRVCVCFQTNSSLFSGLTSLQAKASCDHARYVLNSTHDTINADRSIIVSSIFLQAKTVAMHDRYRIQRTMQTFEVKRLFDKHLGIKSKEEAQRVCADMSRCGEISSISLCSSLKEDKSARTLPSAGASSRLDLNGQSLLQDSKESLQNFVDSALSTGIEPLGNIPSAGHWHSSGNILQNPINGRSVQSTAGQPSSASLDVMDEGLIIHNNNHNPSDDPVMSGNRVTSEMQSPNSSKHFPGVIFSEPMLQVTSSNNDEMSAVAACAHDISELRSPSNQHAMLQPVRRVRSILKLEGGDTRPQESTTKRNSSDVRFRQGLTEMTKGARFDSTGPEDTSLMVGGRSEVLMLLGTISDIQHRDCSSPATRTINSLNLLHNFTRNSTIDVSLNPADFWHRRSSRSLLSTGGSACDEIFTSGGSSSADGSTHAGILINAGGLESKEALRVCSQTGVPFESEFRVDANMKSLSTDRCSVQHMHKPIVQADGSLIEDNVLRLGDGCQKFECCSHSGASTGCNLEGKRRRDVFWMRDKVYLECRTVLTSWGLEIPWNTFKALEHMTQVRFEAQQQSK